MSPTPPNTHAAFFDAMLRDSASALESLAAAMDEIAEEQSIRETQGRSMPLHSLVQNIYLPAELRDEAKRFEANRQLANELSDALNIYLADLESWNWPSAAIRPRTLWTRNKWRQYLAVDLPTMGLLEVLGSYWTNVWESCLKDQTVLGVHERRLAKLLDLGAPEVIITNERRMLAEARTGQFFSGINTGAYWNETVPMPEGKSGEANIRHLRADEFNNLRNAWRGTDYNDDYGGLASVVKFLNAEIRLARRAFPDRPLVVLKLDIQDFYATIPHDVLLTLLEQICVPAADIEFFRKFLSPMLASNEGAQPMRRGVPMGFLLSAALANLLMQFLEWHVARAANVEIIRMVDDIAILASSTEDALAAWRAAKEFCVACGLQFNLAKCGTLALGTERPSELPSGSPRWGLLELIAREGDIEWQVHTETFAAHWHQARERVSAARSIIAKVQQYNANVTYLLNALALPVNLGETHRHSVWATVKAFHADFFGERRGIVSELSMQIREQFELATDVPEAWMYWPLTAGGLGLTNPLVTVGQFAESAVKTLDNTQRAATGLGERPVDWDLVVNDWSRFYSELLDEIQEATPQDTTVMKTLVDDFIKRGQTITSGEQDGLKPYWRWILYTYGPQILQSFGTFRFLLTELVPMQLISTQRLHETSLDDSE